jgi:D-glycero-alpha-D-manno-heptose-7-phosphate kinase
MIIVQTPLRISFAGGGTDFKDYYLEHGGAVLSSAINKYVFVIIKERFDDLICVNYSKREVVPDIIEIKHDLVRVALQSTGINQGIEITTLADIPSEGTGLGSSSSITVGLLHALKTYLGENIDSKYLAKEACRIEIDVLHSPIGYQDQYIAAYGGLRCIQFSARKITIERINLSSVNQRCLSENLMLFYSGLVRKSNDILSEQKNNIRENIDILAEMSKQALYTRDVLLNGEFDEMGNIFRRGWELKKQLASKITNNNVEDILNTAISAGALGGKVTGAGGGGFIMLYCKQGKKDSVRSALHGFRELPTYLEHDGSKVIFNYRRSY